MKVTRKAREALRKGTIKRVEAHPATPCGLDARGRDWNSNTLLLFMESGAVVRIDAGCYHFNVGLRDER